MSSGTPSAPEPPVRRRARSERPSLFSRSLFRYPRRRRHSVLGAIHSPADHPATPVSESQTLSSSFLHRQRHVHPPPEPQPKPIYIYPGLLRIVRDKAIALDNQCPAVLYKCRECRRDQKLPATSPPDPPVTALPSEITAPTDDPATATAEATKCPHQTSCSICLEEFHGKDLVRKLPCNVNHVFHSKCILDWFISHHRCPLCNESVTNTVQARLTAHLNDTRRLPLHSHRGPLDPDVHAQDLHAHNLSQLHPAAPPHLPARDPSRAQPSVHHRRQDNLDTRQKRTSVEKGRKKQRGPRTYSYIVHDNVRMEMNPVIPV